MNTTGTKTLLSKEVRRFLRVPGQTLLQPLISTALYFVVFGYSLGANRQIEGIPYLQFIVPGLIFLGISNNAFLNSSSSIFITKIQGTLVDLLVAPLGPLDLLVGFVVGAMARGLLIGFLTWLCTLYFVGVHVDNPALTVVVAILTSYVFATLGLLAGIWAEKFEQINFFPTFLLMPLTFLGGIFYSTIQLPPPFDTISALNPIAHMIDGMRHAMLGTNTHVSALGISMLVVTAVGATALVHRWLKIGFRLKS
jgi:ABC-2 type transport system permease protein